MLSDAKAISRRLSMAASTWFEGCARGIFPAPIRRGSRWSRWLDGEIEAIERALAAGASDDELRQLSRSLERARLRMKPPIEEAPADTQVSAPATTRRRARRPGEVAVP